MSYMDTPRIHFSGEFFSNPSTRNNDPANFNVGGGAPSDLWNANGLAWIYFQNCTIKRVLTTGGSVKTTTAQDGLVGGTVETTNVPAIAKLVDLDPDFQGGSQIWGAEMQINLASGGGFLKGKLKAPTMRDLWFGRVPGQGMSGAGGIFQSVLTGVTWDTSSTSPVFAELRAASSSKLSIKFVLYAYDATPGSSSFCKGKVVGTIGPSSAGDQAHFLAARSLDQSGAAGFGAAPFKLVGTPPGKVVIDLGNCVPESAVGGSRMNHGQLKAQVINPGGAAPTFLGNLDYSTSHYEQTAGIEEITLTASQATLLANKPLGIWRDNPASQLVMSERPGGSYLDASEVVVRLNPGETKPLRLIGLQFGRVLSGQSIGLKLLRGAPAGALSFPTVVMSGGSATFTASDPGHPRPHIDGQVYQVGFHWGASVASNLRGTIHVLVFDDFTVPAAPTWAAHVEPIMKQYARLYPAMDAMFNLHDHAVLRTNRARLKRALQWPESDPQYMPVTRDLSSNKRQMLIRWVDNGAP